MGAMSLVKVTGRSAPAGPAVSTAAAMLASSNAPAATDHFGILDTVTGLPGIDAV
jgi:hypothetical protein